MTRILGYFLVFSSHLLFACFSLEIEFPLELRGTKLLSPSLGIGPENFKIEGALVSDPRIDACTEMERRSSGNEILLANTFFVSCYPGTKVRHAQEAGYLGIIVANDMISSGIFRYYWNYKDYSDVEIGGVELLIEKHEELKTFASEYSNVSVVMTADDPNQFDDFSVSWAVFFYQLSILIPSLGIFIVSCKKWWNFIQEHGIEFEMAQEILGIQIIACIIRFIFAIDPFSTYHLIPWAFHDGFLTLSFTLSLCSNVIIGFYWQEILNSSHISKKKGVISLRLFKFPCIIVLTVMVVFEISTSIMTAFMIRVGPLITIKSAALAIGSLIVGIFFAYTGILIFVRLLSTHVANRRRMLEFGSSIFLNSLFTLFFFFTGILTPMFLKTPLGYFSSLSFAFLTTEGIAITHISTLKVKRKRLSKPNSLEQTEKDTKCPDTDFCSSD